MRAWRKVAKVKRTDRFTEDPTSATRQELRARAPDFAGNRAASRKSKSYVGQAVLVLEGIHGVISKQCSHPERLLRSGLEVLSGRYMGDTNLPRAKALGYLVEVVIVTIPEKNFAISWRCREKCRSHRH
jgi:hypothetical protein